jgi:hypothetical protein
MNEAQGWVTIIVAVGSAVASIIAAFKASGAKADTQVVMRQQDSVTDKLDIAGKKIDVVHEQTNSRLTRVESELAETRRDLQAALKELNKAETTRSDLAHETAQEKIVEASQSSQIIKP